MTDDLAPLLNELPEPVPPSSITVTVMARIHREVEQKREAERKSGSTVTVSARQPRELQTWVWTFVGLALVLAVTIKGWLSSGSLPDFTSSRIGLGHVALMPVQGSLALLLALGLVIYLGGLFSPLRTRTRD